MRQGHFSLIKDLEGDLNNGKGSNQILEVNQIQTRGYLQLLCQQKIQSATQFAGQFAGLVFLVREEF